MKKIFWMLLLTFGATRLVAQTVVGFNFSGDATTASGWINVNGDPSVGIRTATDPVSHISISSVNTDHWYRNGDVCAFDGEGAYNTTFFSPELVMGFMWVNQGPQAHFNAAIPQLEISGLSTDSDFCKRRYREAYGSAI